MRELNYNIHNLLTMKICSRQKFDPSGDLRYSYFAVSDSPANPDITLNIGPFNPSLEDAVNIAHRFYVRDNYFYCKEKGNKSKWEIEIIGFETGKTIINFNGRKHGLTGILFPSFTAEEFLIPFIECKLAKNKHFLIHGGAVCKDDSGFVFIGRGGVWKTSIIMDFMRTNQYKFLGEDRIILKDDGSIYAFPRAQFVFDYTLKNSTSEERNFLDNLKISFRVLMKETEKNSVKPLARCNKIKKIFFVSRATNQNFYIKNIEPKECLKKIIINNMAEYTESTRKTPIGQFNNYVQIYSLIFPNNDLLRHQHRLHEGVRNIINEKPITEISLPYKYSRTIFENLSRLQ